MRVYTKYNTDCTTYLIYNIWYVVLTLQSLQIFRGRWYTALSKNRSSVSSTTHVRWAPYADQIGSPHTPDVVRRRLPFLPSSDAIYLAVQNCRGHGVMIGLSDVENYSVDRHIKRVKYYYDYYYFRKEHTPTSSFGYVSSKFTWVLWLWFGCVLLPWTCTNESMVSWALHFKLQTRRAAVTLLIALRECCGAMLRSVLGSFAKFYGVFLSFR